MSIISSIGKEGDGKTTLLNNLLKQELFTTDKTVKIVVEEGYWNGDSNSGKLLCIDTPVFLNLKDPRDT
jgi:G3E family GTPase